MVKVKINHLLTYWNLNWWVYTVQQAIASRLNWTDFIYVNYPDHLHIHVNNMTSASDHNHITHSLVGTCTYVYYITLHKSFVNHIGLEVSVALSDIVKRFWFHVRYIHIGRHRGVNFGIIFGLGWYVIFWIDNVECRHMFSELIFSKLCARNSEYGFNVYLE